MTNTITKKQTAKKTIAPVAPENTKNLNLFLLFFGDKKTELQNCWLSIQTVIFTYLTNGGNAACFDVEHSSAKNSQFFAAYHAAKKESARVIKIKALIKGFDALLSFEPSSCKTDADYKSALFDIQAAFFSAEPKRGNSNPTDRGLSLVSSIIKVYEKGELSERARIELCLFVDSLKL